MNAAPTRLGGVSLAVADLSRSLDWYTQLLGARVLTHEAGVAMLGAAEHDTVLLTLHERPGVRPMPSRGRLGLFHVAWLLPDRASLGRFLSHAAARGEAIGSADHLVSEALYLTDPDGLGVEVYVDRPRTEWTVQDGQVAMASLPLDARGVVAAGGGAPWAGMPAGTTIGHVHLHVGDLQRGATFYRDVLGFAVTNGAYPGALFLAADGYHHHLGTNTWAGPNAVAVDDGFARLLHWEVRVPALSHLDAVVARAARADWPTERLAEARLALRDPWGTRVDVVADAA